MRVASRCRRAVFPLFANVLRPRSLGLWDRAELHRRCPRRGTRSRRSTPSNSPGGVWPAPTPTGTRSTLWMRSCKQRNEARKSMLEALDSRRFESFCHPIQPRFPRAHPTQPRARPSARDIATALIEARFRAFAEAADRLGPILGPATTTGRESAASDFATTRVLRRALSRSDTSAEQATGGAPGQTWFGSRCRRGHHSPACPGR